MCMLLITSAEQRSPFVSVKIIDMAMINIP